METGCNNGNANANEHNETSSNSNNNYSYVIETNDKVIDIEIAKVSNSNIDIETVWPSKYNIVV